MRPELSLGMGVTRFIFLRSWVEIQAEVSVVLFSPCREMPTYYVKLRQDSAFQFPFHWPSYRSMSWSASVEGP